MKELNEITFNLYQYQQSHNNSKLWTNFYKKTNNLKTTSNVINKRKWDRDKQSTTKEWGKEKYNRGFGLW